MKKFITLLGIVAMGIMVFLGYDESGLGGNYSRRERYFINNTNVHNTTKISNTASSTKKVVTPVANKKSTPAAGGTTNTNKTTTTKKAESKSSSSNKPVMENTGKYTTKHYKWTSQDGKYTFSFDLNLSNDVYNYCKKLARENDRSKYTYYYRLAEDQTAKQVANAFRQLQKKYGHSDAYIVYEAINFVQTSFTYQTDMDGKGVSEYQKFPIETLMEGRGDCEDTAILLASVLKELGYGSGLVFIPGHCATVIKGGSNISGTYYLKNGSRYYVIESTAKRPVGNVSKDMDWSKATITLY